MGLFVSADCMEKKKKILVLLLSTMFGLAGSLVITASEVNVLGLFLHFS